MCLHKTGEFCSFGENIMMFVYIFFSQAVDILVMIYDIWNIRLVFSFRFPFNIQSLVKFHARQLSSYSKKFDSHETEHTF